MAFWDGTRWVRETPSGSPRRRRTRHVVGAIAEAGLITALTFGLIAGTTFAAKGGNHTSGSGSHHKSSGTSTLTLVMVNDVNGDGSPNWGDTITFDVATTATDSPQLTLTCSQNGTVVYRAETAYYAGYPFAWTQQMLLESQAWTGGAADCSAVLYYSSGKRTITLSTLDFVAAA